MQQQKNNKYYILPMCVCSLRHSACNAQSPYYLWLARFYNIFEKELSNTKCVSTFSLQLLPETLIILKELVINVHRSSCKGPVNLSDFNES